MRFYDDLIKGKIIVINMMYAQCEGICPPMTVNLVKVQARLGDRVGRDIFMYSLTLQPELDTPAVLKDYAEAHGIGPGWLFLTGKRREMEILRRKLGFFDPDPAVDRDKSQHSGLVRFGNEALDRWGEPSIAHSCDGVDRRQKGDCPFASLGASTNVPPAEIEYVKVL